MARNSLSDMRQERWALASIIYTYVMGICASAYLYEIPVVAGLMILVDVAILVFWLIKLKGKQHQIKIILSMILNVISLIFMLLILSVS